MTDRVMGDLVPFPIHRRMGVHEPFRTKRELADHLKVSTRWIELEMKRGGLPFHKDGRSRIVRFRLSEVDAWWSKRRAG